MQYCLTVRSYHITLELRDALHIAIIKGKGF